MWRWRRSDREAELDRELRDHLDLEAEDRLAEGVSSDAARGIAQRTFGSTAFIKEDVREAWGRTWIDRLAQDLRFGLRLLIKAPAFSAITIVTAALGVGASTTIFGQIDAVFWKPLPLPRPRELRLVTWTSRKPAFVMPPNVLAGPSSPIGADTFGSISYPAYLGLRDGAQSFSGLACWADLGDARPVVMREVGFGSVQFVSGNYFDVLEVRPAIGRMFTPTEDTPGAAVAVLSYAFWQKRFGGDPAVTTRTLDLNGKPFAVIGVTPSGFFGMDASTRPDVMLPIASIQVAAASANPLDNRGLWNVCRVAGRIRPGVPEEQARAETERWLRDAILARPPASEYESPRVWLADASRGLETLRDAMSMPLVVLMTVVICILLIGCSNIAGLLIVRGAARQREIATRLALGASRGRLVRQLLTESMLLAICGATLGVASAFALGRVSPAFMSQFMPTLYGSSRQLGVVVSPDVRVLAFSLAATIAVGLLFGAAPARHAARIDLMASIKQPLSSGASRRRFGADKFMVTLQAALALVLVIGAAVFLRTVANLRSVPLGYQLEGLLYAQIEPRTGGVPNGQRGLYFENAVKRLAQTPGVVAATAADPPPLGQQFSLGIAENTQTFCLPGAQTADPKEMSVAYRLVAPDYFATLRAPILAGREFTWSDRAGPDRPNAVIVAMVNDAFVKKYLQGRNPLDERFGLNCPGKPDQFAIVGVAANSKAAPRQTVMPTVYLPLGQTGNAATLIVRVNGPPERIIPVLRRAMSELNAMVPTFGEVTPIDLRERRMQQERLLTTLLTGFAAVAVILSSIGIYGMLTYTVARRTSEIGLRMALGAGKRDVVLMIVRESLAPVALGLTIGAVSAIVATRWIDTLLYGVSAHDPLMMLCAAATFLAVAAVAAVVPARRAAGIDPLRALRFE